ncbi:hypothetical protein CYMTET_9159 [Cymbomonas tetramitiformis]|uniref:GAF domain-containing protein n=1 Tax=Cymbomonas tetramitiformis TaxID=36881 RepID=A0AAE0GRV6_9CHLO|nr:hypothetical protein CYMTET_9159 [Cymbomonas tetramitiformis]
MYCGKQGDSPCTDTGFAFSSHLKGTSERTERNSFGTTMRGLTEVTTCSGSDPSEEFLDICDTQLRLLRYTLKEGSDVTVYLRDSESFETGRMDLVRVWPPERNSDETTTRTSPICQPDECSSELHVALTEENTALIVPLSHSGFLVGVVSAEQNRSIENVDRGAFTSQEKDALSAVAKALSAAWALDQRADLLRRLSAHQATVVNHLLSEMNAPVSAMQTIGSLLKGRLRPKELVQRDLVDGMSTQVDRVAALAQQLQDSAYVEMSNINGLANTTAAPVQMRQLPTTDAESPMEQGSSLVDLERLLPALQAPTGDAQLWEVLATLMPAVEGLIHSTNVVVEKHWETSVPRPLSRRTLALEGRILRQILSHMLDTAMQLCSWGGGRISVDVRQEARPRGDLAVIIVRATEVWIDSRRSQSWQTGLTIASYQAENADGSLSVELEHSAKRASASLRSIEVQGSTADGSIAEHVPDEAVSSMSFVMVLELPLTEPPASSTRDDNSSVGSTPPLLPPPKRPIESLEAN